MRLKAKTFIPRNKRISKWDRNMERHYKRDDVMDLWVQSEESFCYKKVA